MSVGGIIAAPGHAVNQAIDSLVGNDTRHEKLSQLISEAGFSGQDAQVMKAITFAESNGNPTAVGHNTNGTVDVGLAQINSVHKGSFGTSSDLKTFITQMKDPKQNLRVAKALHDARGGFGDWITYNTGRYRIYMSSRRDPDISGVGPTDNDVIGGQVASAVDSVASPFEALANLASVLFQADTWARLGKGGLGGIFVILGTGAMVFVIANKSGVTKAVVKAKGL